MNIKTLLKKTFFVYHKMKPFNIDNAKVVILGTFPGEESLKHNKYYSNPTNQFWKILGIEFGNFKALKDKGIGLWDVIKYCDPKDDSSDKSIKNPKYNDLSNLDGKKIFFNGKKAYLYYKRAVREKKIKALGHSKMVVLPSSSRANTRSPKNKQKAWNMVLNKRSK